MELIDEIEELIMMHQEGSYWDFKREWYDDSKDGDLLIDIICMANNLVDRDAYIIIGVNEECDYAIHDVSQDANRREIRRCLQILSEVRNLQVIFARLLLWSKYTWMVGW